MNMFTNLVKSAVAAAATPVGLVADVLTLPASSYDPHRSPFGYTGSLIEKSKAAFNEAIKPDKS